MTSNSEQRPADVIRRLPRHYRERLRTLDREWPDSVGLLKRIAEKLRASGAETARVDQWIDAMLRGGVDAFTDARNDGEDDTECFGAFVDGLTEALERKHQNLVAGCLTRVQRRVLARRLPPSQQLMDSSTIEHPGTIDDSRAIDEWFGDVE